MFFRKNKDTSNEGGSLSETDLQEQILVEAVKKLKNREVEEGRKLLSTYASKNLESPKLFNLLGISYELLGDKLSALRLYRIAYYLDQSYQPAMDNLHRASNIYEKGFSKINWGMNEGK